MPKNLSIRDVPDELVDLVKERAAKNRHSTRGELLAIVEAVRRPRPPRMTLHEIIEQGGRLGLRTAGDSVEIVRKMRDERYGG